MSLDAMATRAMEDRHWRGDSHIVPEAMQGDKPGPRRSAVASATDTIGTYITTEIVIVYVAAVAAINTPAATSGMGQWVLMWVLLALTPLATWTAFAAKIRAEGDPLPFAPREWPWPQIFIATTAFLLWSFTLPNTPFERLSWYRPGLSAVVLLVGTMVLGLIAPLLRSVANSALVGSGSSADQLE
jgi:hypothetical protein